MEAELDIQYITAVGHAVKKTYFWVTKRTDDHPFMDFVLAVMNMTNAPLIIRLAWPSSDC